MLCRDCRYVWSASLLQWQFVITGVVCAIFQCINDWLTGAGIVLREGTLVDATIIEAPTSTKNKTGERDPEMHQAKKGNQWHFGLKAHIGVDARTGLTHSLATTAANEHDLNHAGELLHGDEGFIRLPGSREKSRATSW